MRRSLARLLTAVLAIAALLACPTPARADTTPLYVESTSATDSAFTVSWVTTTAETGHVVYGTSASSLTSTAYDTRGATTSSNVHHVQLTGLSSGTPYYWKVVSGGTEYGDASGAARSTTTGSSLLLLGTRFVTGQVLDADGYAVAGAVVHVTLRDADGAGSTGDSQTRSALTDASGNWLFLLEGFRTQSLGSGFTVSNSGDTILVTAQGGALGIGSSSVDSGYAATSPTTITTTLVSPGVPAVTGLSRTQGTRTTATSVVITGSNLLFATGGHLSDTNSTALSSFTVVSDTTITAQVPSGVAAGTYDVRIDAPAGTNTTSSVRFTVTSPPVVTTTSLAGWTSGRPYSASLAASDGAAPLSWSVVSGSLPGGVALSTGGTFSGTPAASGTASFTVRVTDASGVTDDQALSLVIADSLSTPSGALPGWTVGRNYGTRSLTTAGGTDVVTWSAAGLPPGLSASGAGRTVSVSGTPTSSGTFTATLTATDAAGSTSSRTFTVDIVDAPTAPSGTLPAWTRDRPYGARTLGTLRGTDSILWSVTGLPPGLTSNASGRSLTIDGTPTAAGSYTVTATVTDAAGASASSTFPIVVNAPMSAPVGSLPAWTVGRDYGTRTVTTSGGTAPVTWTTTGLPPGLSASGSGGTLTVSGTPTTPGAHAFSATATDAAGGQVVFPATLVIADAVTQPTGDLPPWTQGRDYGSRSVTTTGGTDAVTWIVTGLPAGLTASASGRTVVVSGTPTTSGAFPVVATATDAAGSSAARTFDLVVNAPVAAPTGSLPEWTQGIDYGARAITTSGGTGAIAWTVSGLPQGLLWNASDRTLTIAGTSGRAGSSTVTITATDSVGSTATGTWTLVVNAPVAAAAGTLPDWTLGRAYGLRTLTTSGGTAPFTWDVASLPPGLTATPSGGTLTVAGTPTTVGTFTASVVVTDSTGSSASRSIAIVVNPVVTAPAGTLPAWTAGRDYGTRTLATTGGTEAISWSVTGLPAGMAASGSGRTLVVTGSPEAAGSFTVGVTATDAAGSAASASLPLVINPALVPPVGSLPAWTVGRDYGSRTLTTTGGTDPIAWNVSGLPSGLTASAAGRTLTVTGTPTAAGTYSVAATVTDAAGSTGLRALTLVIHPPLSAIAGSLPEWTVGRDYGARVLTTTGGTDPVTWVVAGLPSGLGATFDGRTLTVTGTPTTIGSHSVVLTAADAAGDAVTRTVPLVIHETVTFSGGTLPDWTQGRDYGTRTLTTSGGTSPFTWSATGLPSGLSARASGRDVEIVGTPGVAGTFAVAVTVTDAAGATATRNSSLTINVPVSAPSGTLPDWTAGRPYGTRTVATTGGTGGVTWVVTGLAPGLSSTANGRSLEVSGTPNAAGAYSVSATATDDAGSSATRTFVLTVNPPVAVPAGNLPDWTVLCDYGSRALATTGGTEPLAWSVTNLPPGLSVTTSGRTWTASGTPTVAGTYDVSVTVTDGPGSTATFTRSLVIADGLTSPAGSLPDWTLGRDYGTRALAFTGGTPPLAWSVSGLPAGLTGAADVRTFAVTGTPTSAATSVVLATVSDATGATAVGAWIVTIHPAVATPSSEIGDWTIGRPYGDREIAASGGTPPFVWQVTGLPSGLGFVPDGARVTVRGTPNTAGTFTVVATMTDAAGAQNSVTTDVRIAPEVQIDRTALPDWTIARPYSEALSASGGTPPMTWELVAGGVPGLAFDAAGPRYAGVPTMTDEAAFPVTFRVTDLAGSTHERTYSIRIHDRLVIAAEPFAFAVTKRDGDSFTGEPWIGSVRATEGTPDYVFSLVSGPDGVAVDPATGRITWTPSSHGSFPVTLRVRDAAGATADVTADIEVAAWVDSTSSETAALAVPAGAKRLVLATDLLTGSTMKMALSDEQGERPGVSVRWTDALGDDVLGAKKMKAAFARKAVVVTLPSLEATGRRFVVVAPQSGATLVETGLLIAGDVKYRTKFAGQLDLSDGGMAEIPFSTPAGWTASVRLKKRGSSVSFVSWRLGGGDSVPIGALGPARRLEPATAWGDAWIECASADGLPIVTAWTVSLVRPHQRTRR